MVEAGDEEEVNCKFSVGSLSGLYLYAEFYFIIHLDIRGLSLKSDNSVDHFLLYFDFCKPFVKTRTFLGLAVL
jgi:hypothetical protein